MSSLSVEPELPAEGFEPRGPEEDEVGPFAPFPPIGPADRAPSPPSRAALSPSRRPSSARMRRLLPAEPALFPWLARRLAPGEATIWTGPSIALEPLLELLYVGSARARGRVSLLEGANRFHPYRLGELGRSFGLDARETVRRIRLARAFTAHQMVALVDRWLAEARRHPPTILVGHDLPTLFTDDEVLPSERDDLLRHVARGLAELVRRTGLPLLLTLGPGGVAGFPGLADEGPPWSDYVAFSRGPTSLRLRALRDDARLTLVARPPGQTGIEEFGRENPAEEVIAWDVPSRRTARRSRSG
jgi:hypothetical protein